MHNNIVEWMLYAKKLFLNWVLFTFYFIQRLKAFLKPRSNFSTLDQTHRHRQEITEIENLILLS